MALRSEGILGVGGKTGEDIWDNVASRCRRLPPPLSDTLVFVCVCTERVELTTRTLTLFPPFHPSYFRNFLVMVIEAERSFRNHDCRGWIKNAGQKKCTLCSVQCTPSLRRYTVLLILHKAVFKRLFRSFLAALSVSVRSLLTWLLQEFLLIRFIGEYSQTTGNIAQIILRHCINNTILQFTFWLRGWIFRKVSRIVRAIESNRGEQYRGYH